MGGILLHKNVKNYDLRNLFPIILHRYSYISEYLFVYMISPFINKIIRELSPFNLKILIIGLLINYLLFPSIFEFIDIDNSNIGGFTMNMWFVTLYIIGALLVYILRLTQRVVFWDSALVICFCLDAY